jgi:putative tricarboxylic transport membrane protein
MTLLRSGALTGLAIAAVAVASPASAQFKPSRDVELVIPFGLGGGADILARTIIKIITEEKLVPTTVVAVNKPGGGSATGVAHVVSTKAGDPHTLLLINPQTQITPLRVPEAKGWRDVVPVANFMLDDYMIFARGNGPYKLASDLVKDGKAKPPRAISVASSGTADDMAIAVFQSATGLQFNVARFNSGGEAVTAMIGGHADLAVGNPVEVMGHLKSGSVRALGLMRPTRFEALPDIPTMKEQGIETVPFQMWRGIAVPKGTAPDVVAYWQDVMKKVQASKGMKEYLTANVAAPHPISGEEFVKFLGAQEALYKDMLARLGQK